MVDFNTLRDRLKTINSKSNKKDEFWKPKDEHQVRMLQNPFSKDDPFQEVFFHNEIGTEQPIPCPKMNNGDECAICDFAELLKAWKDPNGNDKPETMRKSDFEIFKKIQAKPRIYVPVIEREKEEKAKWWGMTAAQVQQALEVCTDPDRLAELGLDKNDPRALNVILDPDKGYDLMVSYAKPGEKGNSKTFTQITIKGKIKHQPATKNKDGVGALTKELKSLSELFPKVSSAEIEKLLKKFMGGASPEAKANNAAGEEKYEKKASNTSENAKLTGTKSIDEAFDSMVAEEGA